ncbi:unnamed protein product [Clonostachys byssicola]|uniref:Uncharacterized protein n=1 Tax=Clonostachys byssicola TaxID=160290 RepID=A0A9N9XZX1_9HYPO|nr:unnamed protein product [Clonostachys byssicola]
MGESPLPERIPQNWVGLRRPIAIKVSFGRFLLPATVLPNAVDNRGQVGGKSEPSNNAVSNDPGTPPVARELQTKPPIENTEEHQGTPVPNVDNSKVTTSLVFCVMP